MTRAITLLISCSLSLAARSAPSVVSINLCTDQLVLNVAAPEQILSLSWLATDSNESMMADMAAAYPLNFATAEEVIRFDPEVVIAGRYTNPYTKALLSRLGYKVVEIEPARSIADIESNLTQIGAAIARTEAASRVIAEMRQRIASTTRPGRAGIGAIVVRPGGFTIERYSLAHELLSLAQITDLAAQTDLDEWGSLSVETLVRTNPQLLIVSEYRPGVPSLANAWLEHPAVLELGRERATIRIPARYWSCGAPQSLDTIEILAAAAVEGT